MSFQLPNTSLRAEIQEFRNELNPRRRKPANPTEFTTQAENMTTLNLLALARPTTAMEKYVRAYYEKFPNFSIVIAPGVAEPRSGEKKFRIIQTVDGHRVECFTAEVREHFIKCSAFYLRQFFSRVREGNVISPRPVPVKNVGEDETSSESLASKNLDLNMDLATDGGDAAPVEKDKYGPIIECEKMVCTFSSVQLIDIAAWTHAGRPEEFRPNFYARLSHSDQPFDRTFYFRSDRQAESEYLDKSTTVDTERYGRMFTNAAMKLISDAGYGDYLVGYQPTDPKKRKIDLGEIFSSMVREAVAEVKGFVVKPVTYTDFTTTAVRVDNSGLDVTIGPWRFTRSDSIESNEIAGHIKTGNVTVLLTAPAHPCQIEHRALNAINNFVDYDIKDIETRITNSIRHKGKVEIVDGVTIDFSEAKFEIHLNTVHRNM